MGPHRSLEPLQPVGRSELITWVNTSLSVTIDKVEQCCNGAIYVQLMDLVHPCRVPLARVKFNAALEYEYLQNYKVLQSVFNKLGIAKHIDVQKLCLGKYQDNFEFLQWLRAYVDSNRTVETAEYDGTRRRVVSVIRNCIANNVNAHLTLGTVTNALPQWAQEGVTVRLIKECLAEVKSVTTSPREKVTKENASYAKNVATSARGHDMKLRRVSGATSQKSHSANSATQSSTIDTVLEVPSASAHLKRPDNCESGVPLKNLELLQAERERVAELESLLNESKQQADVLNIELERRNQEVASLHKQLERHKELVESMKKKLGQSEAETQVSKMSKDFYYNKLRKIEIMCQKNDNGRLDVAPLLEIMYATDDDA